MFATNLLSRVRIVMMETSHPGNIGSAARAMMTMGLSDLVLVNPREKNATEHPNAIALASGATDVLSKARVVATLGEAIANVHFAVRRISPMSSRRPASRIIRR